MPKSAGNSPAGPRVSARPKTSSGILHDILNFWVCRPASRRRPLARWRCVVAGKDNGREISRREFTATLGAVAGLTAGANLLTPAEVHAAPHINPRIIGA